MIRNLKELGGALQKIVIRLSENKNLLKLLYFTDKDPLSSNKEYEINFAEDIYEKLIKITPRVGPKETAHSLVAIRVVDGISDKNNNEFRNIRLAIEVFVPLSQWIIKNENLRVFCILGEIQKSLIGQKINGIGVVGGGDFAINFLTDEIACYEMELSITNYD